MRLFWTLFVFSVPWALLLIFYAWLSGLYTVGGVTTNDWIVHTHIAMALIAVGTLVAALWLRRLRLRLATAILAVSPIVIVAIEIWSASRM